jgi:FtsZ-binding cell division protein ZapB
MTQSFWESEVEEARSAPQPEEAAAEPAALSLSVDDFSALEERILRAVNLVKRERLARAEAEERASAAETQISAQAPLVSRLQQEVNGLRAERDHVRQRVERLLAQLDALEL